MSGERQKKTGETISIIEELIPEDQIQQRVIEMAHQIAARYDYDGSNLTVVINLNSGIFFGADLAQAMGKAGLEGFSVDTMAVTKHEGQEELPSRRVVKDRKVPTTGRDVLFVDVATQTGFSLKASVDIINAGRPNSLATAVLIVNPEEYQTDNFPVDFLGFEVTAKNIVGYGLDHNGHHRELPFIGRYW